MRHGTRQAGFTALELIVVLGLMSVMAGMAATGVVGATRRAKVNDAVSAVERAVSHARTLARGNYDQGLPGRSLRNYEVVVDGSPQDKGVRVEHHGEVVFEQRFGPHVHFFVDDALYTGTKSIYFASGTGFTSHTDQGTGTRVTLGVDEDLVLSTPDGHIAFQFAIYEVGMVSIAELER